MGKTVGLRSDNHSCWVKYINVCHVADSLTAITMQLGTKWKIAKTHLWKGICQNTPTTSIFVFYTCSSTFGVLPPLGPLTTWRAACVASNMAWSLLVWLLASPYHLTWPSSPLFALSTHTCCPSWGMHKKEGSRSDWIVPETLEVTLISHHTMLEWTQAAYHVVNNLKGGTQHTGIDRCYYWQDRSCRGVF